MNEHQQHESEMPCIPNTPEKIQAAVVVALVAAGLAATERPSRTSGLCDSAVPSALANPASGIAAAEAVVGGAAAEPGGAMSAPLSWPS
jgi:hypothetical protein